MEDFVKLEDKLSTISRLNNPYSLEAYSFVLKAVEYSMRKLKKRRHIRGIELVNNLVDLAIDMFGPLTIEVLNDWNVKEAEDIGRIVFDLVEVKLLRKTENDSMSDFDNSIDMAGIFRKKFKWKM